MGFCPVLTLGRSRSESLYFLKLRESVEHFANAPNASTNEHNLRGLEEAKPCEPRSRRLAAFTPKLAADG